MDCSQLASYITAQILNKRCTVTSFDNGEETYLQITGTDITMVAQKVYFWVLE